MGFISVKKLLPSCDSFCICCPALRPSSRSPVQRYKKLLADIFPRTPDVAPNERKITKLCEYAAKNPLRIPKIAKFLEQRAHKELRSGHANFIKIIAEAYNKLLFICKEQMVYFAVSLLTVLTELLNCQHNEILILGCQTLTRFIYSQVDSTYERSIEKLIAKLCTLSHQQGDDNRLLRAASLQCLSAMVWFMNEQSHIFQEFDEIVFSVLENYPLNDLGTGDDQRLQVPQHNWVDEIVRLEGRAGSTVGTDPESSTGLLRITPIRDSSTLTRAERESPEVWSHICVCRLAELAKETTTMRRVLDPMFSYFDVKRQWTPRRGLALHVLYDMCCQEQSIGNEQWILSAIVRHLDHKNVLNDPQTKLYVVETATIFARELRYRGIIPEIAAVADLCRQLRKCLEASESAGLKEINSSESFQHFLEDCLSEIIKGINDIRPLYDMMSITLENLAVISTAARATIGSLLVLSHVVSLAPCSSNSMIIFPEALLLQILKLMMHPDVEIRLGGHYIFASILIRNPRLTRVDSEYLYETKKWQSRTTNVFASATALLEKLRREKDIVNGEKLGTSGHNDFKEKSTYDEYHKYSWALKNSLYFSKLVSSLINGFSSRNTIEMEQKTVMLTEEQTALLLSSFWIQANQADNLPFNFEAIGHSYSLTLFSSYLKNSGNSSIVRFFQLPISLRNIALAPASALRSSCQRSLFSLATSMLAFAGKVYRVMELADLLQPFTSSDIDPFMRIGDGLQLYVNSQTDQSRYGSYSDQQAAKLALIDLRKAVGLTDDNFLNAIIYALLDIAKVDKVLLTAQLTETFIPEDLPFFGSSSSLIWESVRVQAFSEESLSLNEESSRKSSADCAPMMDLSAANASNNDLPTSSSHVLSVGQLLESALNVAGQAGGASISTSPLPYGTMASQCEALGSGAKKISNWFTDGPDANLDEHLPEDVANIRSPLGILKVNMDDIQDDLSVLSEPWVSVRLPPASPFDNFLRAASSSTAGKHGIAV